jgi:hypothetical protein
MADRKKTFTDAIEEYDEAALKKAVDFKEHRFVSIEHDKMTSDRYAKGHKSLRGACNHLARSVQEGDTFLPEFILDLDSGQRYDLDLFVHVAPKSVNAVSVMLPRELALAAIGACDASAADQVRQAGQMIKGAIR